MIDCTPKQASAGEYTELQLVDLMKNNAGAHRVGRPWKKVTSMFYLNKLKELAGSGGVKIPQDLADYLGHENPTD